MVDASSGNGELRAALESILTCRLWLDVAMGHLSERLDSSSRHVGRALAGAGERGLRIADEMLAGARIVKQNARTSFGDAAGAMDRDSHDLLAVLASRHGHDSREAFTPAPTGKSHRANDATRFPAGFTRTYAKAILQDLPDRLTMTLAEAAAVPVTSPGVTALTVLEIKAQFPHAQGQLVFDLLTKAESHAVERHGYHVERDALLARLLWQKDNAGLDSWSVGSDGKVGTSHKVSTKVTRFTSAEAFAKPLRAVMSVAEQHQGGVIGFVEQHAVNGRLTVYVDRDSCGLTSADAVGFRGVGNEGKAGANDWHKARRAALRPGGIPMSAVEFNPFSEGDEPGAIVMFAKGSDGWRIDSCVPASRALGDRLEDLA
ncbi:MAG TPA: hypothetical protein VIP77_00285 [Jiangellaceae bacterium]